MKTKHALLGMALSIAISTPAQTANIALGKQYAYLDIVPYEFWNGNYYYRDDTHPVDTLGLGVFGAGQLTDGLIQSDTFAALDIPSPDIAYYGAKGRIIIDLGATFLLASIDLGTNRWATPANFRPESVNLLFSSTGYAGGDFGAPIFWDIPTDNIDGHTTFTYTLGAPVSARYVQLDFQTAGQPNEIHFDELGINGSPLPIPSTALLILPGLAGLRMLGRRQAI